MLVVPMASVILGARPTKNLIFAESRTWDW
jgi:hypothetical protein